MNTDAPAVPIDETLARYSDLLYGTAFLEEAPDAYQRLLLDLLGRGGLVGVLEAGLAEAAAHEVAVLLALLVASRTLPATPRSAAPRPCAARWCRAACLRPASAPKDAARLSRSCSAGSATGAS